MVHVPKIIYINGKLYARCRKIKTVKSKGADSLLELREWKRDAFAEFENENKKSNIVRLGEKDFDDLGVGLDDYEIHIRNVIQLFTGSRNEKLAKARKFVRELYE